MAVTRNWEVNAQTRHIKSHSKRATIYHEPLDANTERTYSTSSSSMALVVDLGLTGTDQDMSGQSKILCDQMGY